MTLWPRNKPLSQPPHYGGLSLSAGKAQRTEPHSSIAVKQDEGDGYALKPMSDKSGKQETR